MLVSFSFSDTMIEPRLH